MNRYAKTTVMTFALLLVFATSNAGILGGVQPGIRAGHYNDADEFFLGVDVKVKAVFLNADPSIEYVFINNGKLMTFNLDGFVNILNVPLLSGFVGGGVGLMYFNPDVGDSSTDPVVNLIGGVEFGVTLNPYIMLKWIIADHSDGFVGAVGIRF